MVWITSVLLEHKQHLPPWRLASLMAVRVESARSATERCSRKTAILAVWWRRVVTHLWWVAPSYTCSQAVGSSTRREPCHG